MRRAHPALSAALLCAACGASGDAVDAGARDAGAPDASAPAADWVIAADAAAPAGRVGPELLGRYDLSTALFDYGADATLAARLREAGVRDLRVGVGRWEIATRLLPARTDGVSCAPLLATLPPALAAPPGSTDETLVADRDFFVDDGAPVTLADTQQDARYALGYVRRVIDQAKALGATPFVDLDLMPRALAKNRVFSRAAAVAGAPDPCLATFSNAVSNAPPADPRVFAAAAVGLVRRVVEGSGGEPGRDAPAWEIWNEPELAYAWAGSFDEYATMALSTLVALDAYRAAATDPRARALRFGLGSFARVETAASVLQAIDAAPLPGGAHAPVDFVSVHAYGNDASAIVAGLAGVTAARDASTRYRGVEIVLAEWGPSLEAPPDPSTMDVPLLVATVLARAPAVGVGRAHASLVRDLAPGLPFAAAPLTSDDAPRPVFHALALAHALVGDGGDRLAIEGAADGAIGGGAGAAIVLRGADGRARALVVNGDASPHDVRVDLGGAPMAPTRVRVFDAPASPPRDVAPSVVITAPARSVVLVEG